MSEQEKIIIVDFGAQYNQLIARRQYNQLIARRIREERVYSLVVPYDVSVERIRELAPKGIIFTGGPSSVHQEGAPKCDPAIYDLGIPVLGICYGAQLMAEQLGGRTTVRRLESTEKKPCSLKPKTAPC